MPRKVTEGTKKMIAGRQQFKCANSPDNNISKLENYSCPLWKNEISPGNFDESGYEIDHIEEFAISQNDNIDNLQALCISCHRVKTKHFNIKKLRLKDDPIFGKEIYKCNNRKTYMSCTKKVFENSKSWSKNRPVDMDRVCEIANHLNKQDNKLVDGIIYLAILKDEGIICYDGNHRRNSFKYLNGNYKCIVDVIEYPSFNELKQLFMNLNKCVPISELYHNPDAYSLEQKNIINNIANKISLKWKNHKSNSPRPRKPNFNREVFVNELTKILVENALSITEHRLYEALLKLNEFYKNKYIHSSSISSKMREKCIANECYLFLGTLSNLIDYV